MFTRDPHPYRSPQAGSSGLPSEFSTTRSSSSSSREGGRVAGKGAQPQAEAGSAQHGVSGCRPTSHVGSPPPPTSPQQRPPGVPRDGSYVGARDRTVLPRSPHSSVARKREVKAETRGGAWKGCEHPASCPPSEASDPASAIRCSRRAGPGQATCRHHCQDPRSSQPKHCMHIGLIPGLLRGFFELRVGAFSSHAWRRVWGLSQGRGSPSVQLTLHAESRQRELPSLEEKRGAAPEPAKNQHWQSSGGGCDRGCRPRQLTAT